MHIIIRVKKTWLSTLVKTTFSVEALHMIHVTDRDITATGKNYFDVLNKSERKKNLKFVESNSS